MLTRSVIDLESLLGLFNSEETPQSQTCIRDIIRHLTRKAVLVYDGERFETSSIFSIFKVIPGRYKKDWALILRCVPRLPAANADWDGVISEINFQSITAAPALIAIDGGKCQNAFSFKAKDLKKKIGRHEVIRLQSIGDSDYAAKSEILWETPITQAETLEKVWRDRFFSVFFSENISIVTVYDPYLFQNIGESYRRQDPHNPIEYFLTQILQTTLQKRTIKFLSLEFSDISERDRLCQRIQEILKMAQSSIRVELLECDRSKVKRTKAGHDRIISASAQDWLYCVWSVGKGPSFFDYTPDGHVREETDMSFKNNPEAIKPYRERLTKLQTTVIGTTEITSKQITKAHQKL